MWKLAAFTGNSLETAENWPTIPQPTPLVLSPAINQPPVSLNLPLEVGYIIASPMPRQAAPSVDATARVHQHDGHNEARVCDRCEVVWCAHSECILRASVNRGDDHRQTQLLSSYENLRDHIPEHLLDRRATCSSCENLFYRHSLQLCLLFGANSAEVRLSVINNLMKLRKHVEEVHGRF